MTPRWRGSISALTIWTKSAQRRTVKASCSRMSRTDSTRSTNSTTVSCRTSAAPASRTFDRSVRAGCFSPLSTASSFMLIRLRDPGVAILDGMQWGARGRERTRRNRQQPVKPGARRARRSATLSGNVLQPLPRLEDFCLARRGCVAFFLFLFDDFFRRVGDELLVGELGVDALDVGFGLGQFLVEPGLLCRKINHPFERQGRDLAAHQ